MTTLRPLQRFSNGLEVQERGFIGVAFHAVEEMERAKELISAQLQNFGPPVPSEEVVAAAIREFISWCGARGKEPLSWMETAFVCWGLLTPIAVFKGKTILDSKPLFVELLRLLDMQGEVGSVTPYLWRGLLNGYLAYRPGESGVATENWSDLRQYLSKSLPTLVSETQIKPAWLGALFDWHRSVLSQSPFDKYRAEVFSEDCPMVASLNADLEIPETSWFWPGLLLQGIGELAESSDKKFKSKIEIVLVRLKEHESCHSEGLAMLLDRYASSETTEPHEALKFHAVSRWRSPTLERQRNWERVKPETKRMVQRWLVLEDLRDFFKTLHADDAMNRRRYEFWMQFLDQMSYVHLVLGRHARESYPKLLGNKIGRYSELKGAGAKNNAFIMRIGKYFFVEFGEVGKCWGYEESTIKGLIPNLNYVGSISYNELRAAGHCVLVNNWGQRDGLSHQGDWELKFTESFSRLGIGPDSMSLKELTDRYQLQILDRRKESDSFWVRHDQVVGAVADYLRHASFRFKNRAEGYYARARGLRWDK